MSEKKTRQRLQRQTTLEQNKKIQQQKIPTDQKRLIFEYESKGETKGEIPSFDIKVVPHKPPRQPLTPLEILQVTLSERNKDGELIFSQLIEDINLLLPPVKKSELRSRSEDTRPPPTNQSANMRSKSAPASAPASITTITNAIITAFVTDQYPVSAMPTGISLTLPSAELQGVDSGVLQTLRDTIIGDPEHVNQIHNIVIAAGVIGHESTVILMTHGNDVWCVTAHNGNLLWARILETWQHVPDRQTIGTGAWNTFGAIGQGAIDATEAAAPIVERAGTRAGTGAWNAFGAIGQGAIDATEVLAPIVGPIVRDGVEMGLQVMQYCLVSAWATGAFLVNTIVDKVTAADPDGDDPGGGSYTGTKEKTPRKKTPKPRPVPRMLSGLQRGDDWLSRGGHSHNGRHSDNGKLYKPSFKQFTL
jgi:hypothetical protein